MALQTSGAISLNDIHVEAGGSSGTSVGINDTDVRDLTGVSSQASSSFSSFYGASSAIVFDGPLSIVSNDLSLYYSLFSPGWIGYFADFSNNWVFAIPSNPSKINPFPEFPHGDQVGGVPHLPNTHTPTGHKIRMIGKNQSYPDKGEGTGFFKLALSGHLPNDNNAFNFLRINKNQSQDTTLYRSSASHFHTTAATKYHANTVFFQDTATFNPSDPITIWSWAMFGPKSSSVFLNAYVNAYGWNTSGATKNVEIQ
tara:strand:+ start:74 stop:838 length:765 start_codon:yes stop_codon:yes gene_type:complete